MQALRFSNDEIDAVAQLVELHLRFHGYGSGEWTDSAVRRYVRDAGDQLERLHVLTRADCTTRNQRKAERLRRTYDDLEERIARLSEEEELASIRPDLDGNQIMEILGIGPGREVGEAYRFLLELRLDHGPSSYDEAKAALLAVVGRTARGDARELAPPVEESRRPGRRPLLDRTGDHHRDRRPRRGRAPPARAGRPRRRDAARRPVDGDRGAGRRPAPGAGRAAHRLGQVGGLLRRHAAAAGRGRRPDGDRLAAAGADAQPDRGRRAGRHPRGHDQLHQHRGVGADPGRRRRRRGRRAAGQPRAAQQPRLPRRGAARGWPRPAGCWWSTRRTASPTGATTSGPTTAGSAPCSPTCPTGIPVLATTATANARVTADVAEQLARLTASAGPDVLVLRGSLDRESLRLGVVRLPTPEQRLGWLADHLAEQPGSGIVYCLTVAATQEIADYLRSRGHDVAAYSGQTEPTERLALEQDLPPAGSRRWSPPARSAWASTPTLGFVVNLGAPQSPVAYYQQVGRAGRGTDRRDGGAAARARGPRHLGLLRLARVPAARSRCARRCACSPRRARPLSTAALETYVDLGRTRLETMLKVLDVDGAVRRVRGGWEATGQPWAYDAGALRPGQRGPRARAAGDARLPRHRPAAGCGSCATSSTTRTTATSRAAAATTAAASTLPTRGLRRRGRRGRASGCARPGCRRRAAQDVADRAGQPRARPQGQDRRRRRGGPRGRPAHRPRPRPGAARRCSRPSPDDGTGARRRWCTP